MSNKKLSGPSEYKITGKKNCTPGKSYNCGKACISLKKNCRKNAKLEPKTTKKALQLTNAIVATKSKLGTPNIKPTRLAKPSEGQSVIKRTNGSIGRLSPRNKIISTKALRNKNVGETLGFFTDLINLIDDELGKLNFNYDDDDSSV